MTEVVGDNMTMLGGRRDDESEGAKSPEVASEKPIAKEETSEQSIAEEDSTDDLPF